MPVSCPDSLTGRRAHDPHSRVRAAFVRMTEASSIDAALASAPAPVAFQPTSEAHRWYCDPAEDASQPVSFSRAPRGVSGGEDLFAPTRALLESVTLSEFLDARRSELEPASGRAGRLVTTLDVSTTADEALRILAKTAVHSAPLVDKQRRAFLGFVDVDDLISGFFARVERTVPPPSMPANAAAAAAHAERRAETLDARRGDGGAPRRDDATSFVREEGRRRWIEGIDKTSLAEAVEAFTTSTLADLRSARAGAEDGRMVYRGARDASLMELVRSGFLRPVAKPAATAPARRRAETSEGESAPTVADVPPRATTCHRVATYRLQLDPAWRADAMVVDAIVSQWDACRFLRDCARRDLERLDASDAETETRDGAFRASLRELGMVSDSGNDSHQKVVTVTLRASALEAFSKMHAAGVSCVGVTSEAYAGEGDGPLVGVLTANDFRVAFVGPGETRRLPDWTAGELLGSVDAFLYRIRTVRLFWERRAVRDAGQNFGERDSPATTPATTYLRSVTRDATFFDVLDALVTGKTHHVFVVDAFRGHAVRVITPADVLRAIASPGRTAIGWRYRERASDEEGSRKKKNGLGRRKTFTDGARRADGGLAALELGEENLDEESRDTSRCDVTVHDGDDPLEFPVGFAGRFDDEL